MKKIILSLILIYLSAFSQAYEELAGTEFYFLRSHGTRLEAMGKTACAVSDDINSAFYNPAMLSSDPATVTVTGSIYKPMFTFEDSEYRSAGAALKIFNRLKLGFFYNEMTYGQDISVPLDTLGGSISYEPELKSYNASLAFKAGRQFSIGIGGNMVEFDIIGSDGMPRTERRSGLDAGISAILNYSKNSSFRERTTAALSIKNVIKENEGGYALPTVFYAGIESTILPRIRNPFGDFWALIINLNGDYQSEIDGFHSMAGAGAEFLISEMIALRAGIFKQKINENSPSKYMQQITYGAGLNIPLYRFSSIDIPVLIKIDYCNMKAPEIEDFAGDIDNFNSIALTVEWRRSVE
ncbi:MAG TPA: hypothetical protein PLK90_04155 [Clostridiales bacterium]|nr:hypothetical protein [Clostridiales bacterium]HQP69574.1 hypothetical protein [Clostridiales bacterium]